MRISINGYTIIVINCYYIWFTSRGRTLLQIPNFYRRHNNYDRRNFYCPRRGGSMFGGFVKDPLFEHFMHFFLLCFDDVVVLENVPSPWTDQVVQNGIIEHQAVNVKFQSKLGPRVKRFFW